MSVSGGRGAGTQPAAVLVLLLVVSLAGTPPAAAQDLTKAINSIVQDALTAAGNARQGTQGQRGTGAARKCTTLPAAFGQCDNLALKGYKGAAPDATALSDYQKQAANKYAEYRALNCTVTPTGNVLKTCQNEYSSNTWALFFDADIPCGPSPGTGTLGAWFTAPSTGGTIPMWYYVGPIC